MPPICDGDDGAGEMRRSGASDVIERPSRSPLRRAAWMPAAVVLVAALPISVPAGAQTGPVEFTVAGTHTLTIPDDVCTIEVVAVGAAGSTLDGTTIRPGGEARASIEVPPGEPVQVRVGGAGSGPSGLTGGAGGHNGGGNGGNGGIGNGGAGGGGASDVRVGSFGDDERVVVAGGGAGDGNGSGPLGAASGGSGGGLEGLDGGSTVSADDGGRGATQLGPGASAHANPGVGPLGGDGGFSVFAPGGGGGGGWFGGGGGAGNDGNGVGAGGGGGGSGFTPDGTGLTSGVDAGNDGDGRVTITFIESSCGDDPTPSGPSPAQGPGIGPDGPATPVDAQPRFTG